MSTELLVARIAVLPRRRPFAALLTTCLLSAAGAVIFNTLPAASATDRPDAGLEYQQLAVEAYQYLYPLVIMDLTRRQSTSAAASASGNAPPNQFAHMRSYLTAKDRQIVRVGYDTLYSKAWLDLSGGPVIVSMPATDGRYYNLPFQDMWMETLAVAGPRTSGSAAIDVAIVPPGWRGQLPYGVERLDSPTRYVFVPASIQATPDDYDVVRNLQDAMKITSLTPRGRRSVASDPDVDIATPAVYQMAKMPAAEFFDRGMRLMADNRSHATDWSQLTRMRRLGLVPGRPFDLATSPAPIRAALEQAAADSPRRLRARLATLAPVRNGWMMLAHPQGNYGNWYEVRAVYAMIGLGALPPEDALYPQLMLDNEGRPLSGEHRYRLRFSAGQLPPADGLWSITLYRPDGFPYDNPLNRYAISSHDSLRANPDGSVDILIQHEAPDGELLANWLPSPPEGPLSIMLRLYMARPEVFEGRWLPPVAERLH